MLVVEISPVHGWSNPLEAFRARRAARQLHKTILSRRTINEFDPVLPKHWESALESAVEAATYAPNHKRTEPWRFRLLGNEAIQKVCELNARIVTESKGRAAGNKKLQRWLAMPGWLVVTCQRSSNDDNNWEDPMGLAREDYAACCCAVQNLCLSLHAQGIGTKWTTGPVNFHSDFAQAVGFNHQTEYVVGTLWFGTPKVVPSPPAKKLQTLIRHD